MAKRIMIVDDSASIRKMVSYTLKEHGYEVVEAADGKEALEKLKGDTVHMVITDVHMPHINGIELIRELRSMQSYRFVPVVVLTTEAEEKKKQEGKVAGASGWIVKPFKPDLLMAVVSNAMG